MADARYERQVPVIGEEGQSRLSGSLVAVVGLGGTGSAASIYLAAAGANLRLIDWDVVEEGNLNRQILYGEGDLGRPKALAAADRLSGLNGEIELEVVHEPLVGWNALRVLSGADLVVDATDNFQARYVLGEACVRLGLPHTFSAVRGTYGLYTFVIPGETPCLRCIFPEPPPEESGPPVLGPTPGVAGTLSAAEAIKHLTGIGSTSRGRLISFDLSGMEFDEISIARNPNCPVCGRGEFKRLGAGPERAFVRGDRAYLFLEVGVGDLVRDGWEEVGGEEGRYALLSKGRARVYVYDDGGALVSCPGCGTGEVVSTVTHISEL